MSTLASPAPRTLADVVPGGIVRNIALVLGGSVFVGITAQLAIPLPFTPVPLTLQTFAVLLTVAALGSIRGLVSMALYVVAGVAGVPWFSDHSHGFAFASFGYVVGFLLAAVVVGKLSEGGADRKPLTTAGQMVLGNLAIYAVGVPGLMLFTGMGLGSALLAGVVPFLIGDAIKIAVAAGLLPLTWKVIGRKD